MLELLFGLALVFVGLYIAFYTFCICAVVVVELGEYFSRQYANFKKALK